MSMKISKAEIEYNRRISEEDRLREIQRQRAHTQAKATAHLLRKLPVEKGFHYLNSNGDHVSPDHLSISLC